MSDRVILLESLSSIMQDIQKGVEEKDTEHLLYFVKDLWELAGLHYSLCPIMLPIRHEDP